MARQVDGQDVEVFRETGEQCAEVVLGGADAVQQQEGLTAAGAVMCEEGHVRPSAGPSSPADPHMAGVAGHSACG